MNRGKENKWQKQRASPLPKHETAPPQNQKDPDEIELPDSHKLRVRLNKNGKGNDSPVKQFKQLAHGVQKLVTYGGARFGGRGSSYLAKKYPFFEVTLVAVGEGEEPDREMTVRVLKSDVYVAAHKSNNKWYGFLDENFFNLAKSMLKSGYGACPVPDIALFALYDAIVFFSSYDGKKHDAAQGYMYLIFWFISEAARLGFIYNKMCRVSGSGWGYSEKITDEEFNVVQNWRSETFKLIDACLSPTNTFVPNLKRTGITTLEESRKHLLILKMEDLPRLFNRWPLKYRPQNDKPQLLKLPKSKSSQKTTEKDVIEFWRRRPKHINEDQWKSFKRFANLCRDSEDDIARNLLMHISVVEVDIQDPTKYKVKFVDTKCSKVWHYSFPCFLFEKRVKANETYSDEEQEEVVFEDSVRHYEAITD